MLRPPQGKKKPTKLESEEMSWSEELPYRYLQVLFKGKVVAAQAEITNSI
jgi:hypothetical protein